MPRRPHVVVIACLLVAGLLGVGTPATASAATEAARTAPGTLRGVITFDKNWRNPQDSTLVWRVFRHHDGERTLVELKRWRAGSGFTRNSTNPCIKNDGWLPNGDYAPRLHANYWGSLIKGRAIYLGAKRCPNGTMRTDLFIHTEQGDRNAQCPDRRGDQICRWEYPKINDYKSFGCIKMSPHDLRELYDAWLRHFRLGSDSRVRVQVVS